jgi:hypothetical protein
MWEGSEKSSTPATKQHTSTSTTPEIILKALADDSGWGATASSAPVPSGWTDYGGDREVAAIEVTVRDTHLNEYDSEPETLWPNEPDDLDKGKDLCPVHMMQCKPGICAEMARKKALEKKAKNGTGGGKDAPKWSRGGMRGGRGMCIYFVYCLHMILM